MKNPFPMVILTLLVLACAMFVSSAHAQVLGWVLVGEDDEAQDLVVLDAYPDQYACLASRDDFISYLAQQGKTLAPNLHLYCAPVRPS